MSDPPKGELSAAGKAPFFSGMSLQLSNTVAREWVSKRRELLRPWGDFFNTKRFHNPSSPKMGLRRVLANVEHFQSNYMCIFVGLFIYCIVTSPVLLFALAAFLGACYIIHIKNAQGKILILGREVTVGQQYMVAGALSFLIFFFAGAGDIVFWILGVSFFIILLHAYFHDHDVAADGFELEMEPV